MPDNILITIPQPPQEYFWKCSCHGEYDPRVYYTDEEMIKIILSGTIGSECPLCFEDMCDPG